MKSLINILSETIVDKIHEQDESPLIDAQVTPPNDQSDHYLDKTPDKGWVEFWLDWNGDDLWLALPSSKQNEYRNEAEASTGKNLKSNIKSRYAMSLTDEEFLKKYDKSREDFREDFRDEIVLARKKTINKYKKYYSGFVPFQKIYKQVLKQVTDDAGGRTYMNHVRLEGDAHGRAQEIQSKLIDTLENMRTTKSKTLVHYNKIDVRNAGGSSYDAWGWVHPGAGGVQGEDVYNLNLYAFTNPGLDTWRTKLKNTTHHEIGHNISHILNSEGINAYTDIKSQGIYDGADITKIENRIGCKTSSFECLGMWEDLLFSKREKIAKEFGMSVGGIANTLQNNYYVNRPAEDYARIQQLRKMFGVGSNSMPDAKWWASKFYKKFKSGEITTGDVMQTRELRIPKYGFTLNGVKQEKEYLKKGDWEYNCGIQKFLWSQGIFGVGKIENGKEVCDGAYGPNTKAAVKKFYKDMISPSKLGTKIFITIPKVMLKYNNLPEDPKSYSELWRILSKSLHWSGMQMADIAALFAKSAWDTQKSITPPREDELEIAIDFEFIQNEDETFVMGIEDDLDYKMT